MKLRTLRDVLVAPKIELIANNYTNIIVDYTEPLQVNGVCRMLELLDIEVKSVYYANDRVCIRLDIENFSKK